MRLCVVAGILWTAGAVLGQPVPGQPPGFTCVANAGNPVIVRTEGITELVGDLLLQCTGGAPTPKGLPLPTTDVKVFLNTNITSRLLGNGFSDALLLIDEPGSGLPGAATGQKVCQEPFITNCPLVGTNGGFGIGGPFATTNIFQAQISTGGTNPIKGAVGSNSVEWNGVPIDAPGTNGIRQFRFTNVRANAAQLGLSTTLIPTQIIGYIQISGGSFLPAGVIVPIDKPQQTLATLQQGLTSLVFGRTGQDCPGISAIGNFGIMIKENVPFALKKANIGQTLMDPTWVLPQNIPGKAYNTEDGFVLDPSAGGSPRIGRADFATPIHINVQNVPGGVSLVVPKLNPMTDTSGAPGGTLVAAGGAPSGNNQVFGADANGNADLFLFLGDRTNTPNPVSANITVTPVGIAASLPANLKGTVTFPYATFEQNSLYIPGSPNYLGVPSFAPQTTGITTPKANPYTTFETLTICDPFTQSLQTGGDPVPMFQSYSGPLVPASFNYSVVSPGMPAGNISVSKDPAATWLNVSLNQTTTPVTATITVNPSTVTQSLTSNLVFSSRDIPGGGNLTVPVTYKVTPGPWFTRYGMENAGSYVADVVAPGELFLLAGNAFGPAQLAGLVLDSNGRATTILGNTQVLFDNQPVPLDYVFSSNGLGYVTGFAPFALDGKTTTNVQVVYNGVPSPPVAIPVVDAVPALFTSDATGGGQGAILNGDLSYNSAANPEAIGNQVILFGTGAGQTTPGGRDGAVAGVGGALGTFKLPIKVFFDGIQATDVAYAGPAPSEIEGVFQINVRIPAGAQHGKSQVIVQVGDKLSQPGVTVAVQ